MWFCVWSTGIGPTCGIPSKFSSHSIAILPSTFVRSRSCRASTLICYIQRQACINSAAISVISPQHLTKQYRLHQRCLFGCEKWVRFEGRVVSALERIKHDIPAHAHQDSDLKREILHFCKRQKLKLPPMGFLLTLLTTLPAFCAFSSFVVPLKPFAHAPVFPVYPPDKPRKIKWRGFMVRVFVHGLFKNGLNGALSTDKHGKSSSAYSRTCLWVLSMLTQHWGGVASVLTSFQCDRLRLQCLLGMAWLSLRFALP